MAGNGNGNKWVFWLVGLLATIIIVIALPTMAKAIWENDRSNTNQHDEIKETMIRRDEKMMDSLHRFDVRQEVLIKTVDRIERKL